MDKREAESTTFSFSGGWLCLDFCNTADGDIRGEWTENLREYGDLVLWGREAGSITEDEASRLLRSASERPEDADQTLQKARALRRVIYDVFSAVADAQQPQLSAFNTALGEAAAHVQIVTTSDNFNWDWPGESLEKPLWPVIWSAAELLLSDKRALVRECGSETCSWLFLDTSRNHSRRWCDMKGCGNRAKARRHYARIKASE